MPRRRKATTRKSTRKTRKSTMRGKGIKDVLRFVKDNKIISQGLGILPFAGAQVAGKLAGMVGLGRRRRSTRRAGTMRGRGFFQDLGGGIGSVFGGLGSGVGSIAHGLFGGGAKGSVGRARRVIKI